MENVKILKEIKIVAENKIGLLSEVSEKISKEGVNIEDISAFVIGGEAIFYLITNNNEKIKDIFKKEGYYVEEREVVVLTLENRPGALSKIAKKFKEEGIDINYIYATSGEKGEKTNVIFYSDNNEKAYEIAKYILSLSKW